MQTRLPLPAWAAPHPTSQNAVLVDPDLMYPAILGELGVAEDAVTQYWLEVAYQFMKMDLQVAAGRFGFTIHVRADDGRKDRWRMAGFPDPEAKPGKPETRGEYRASKGREARAHYKRLRGFVPG